MIINGYNLQQTCYACPEQYDVYNEENAIVGYLRLRHGHFSAEYPDVGGELVYKAQPRGDGMFEEDEREFHLNGAVNAIHTKIKESA